MLALTVKITKTAEFRAVLRLSLSAGAAEIPAQVIARRLMEQGTFALVLWPDATTDCGPVKQ